LDNNIKRADLEKSMLISFGTGKSGFVAFCVFLLINQAITQIIIKDPPARKRSIAFFCRGD